MRRSLTASPWKESSITPRLAVIDAAPGSARNDEEERQQPSAPLPQKPNGDRAGDSAARMQRDCMLAGPETTGQLILHRRVGLGLGAGQRDDGQLAEPLQRANVVEKIPTALGPVVEQALAERGDQVLEGHPDQLRRDDVLRSIRRPRARDDTLYQVHRRAGPSPAAVALGESDGEVRLGVPQNEVVERAATQLAR